MFYVKCVNFVAGVISSELCNNTKLRYFNFQTNPGISCYAGCLTSVYTLTTSGRICAQSPTPQDKALCGFIASTNIASKSGYNEWVCDSSRMTIGDPCYPLWTGLTCLNRLITRMDLDSLGFTGSIPPELGQISSL